MNKRLAVLLGMLLAGRCVWAQEDTGKLRVLLSTGYQSENFHWSIAGNSAGRDPNVYSELKWRRVSGPVAGVDLEWSVWRRWCVLAGGSRAFIRSGTVTDTDYGLDNRNDVLYSQSFSGHSGDSYAWSAGIGYRVLEGALRLTPYLGYGGEGQSLSVSDAGGLYSLLNSHYTTRWSGPLVRVDAGWRLGGRWGVEGRIVYHQVNYSAKADWNLISTFSHPVSFEHTADGYGIEAVAGLRYRVGRWFDVGVGAGYFDWRTGEGIDALYLASGQTDKTQLNGVVRQGWEGFIRISGCLPGWPGPRGRR
jgi:hypothetical protein